MTKRRLFSQHYSNDITKHTDTIKFRERIVKYLHDVINSADPLSTQKKCRQKMGITIPAFPNSLNPMKLIYAVEDSFNKIDIKINDILDLITVTYDSWEEMNPFSLKDIRKHYVTTINEIFDEESMCYLLHEEGCVRYYPDEEFQILVKATLAALENKIYSDHLKQFNNVLDEAYGKKNTETPIRSFFALIESFVLSIVKKEHKQLNTNSVDELHTIIKSKITDYTSNDFEAINALLDGLKNWIKMCHKYRHGKGGHTHASVPKELFDYIFSSGISIYRFLLNINDKWQLQTTIIESH